ncbi:MAG: hypothetical protein C0613_00755 [Desulfobulbaceae bacterium]|nr:MAG: hypothetical protein C0613_00755 [Desulfobulbaceae bacterium]
MLSQQKQKNDTSFWDQRRGKIYTRKGGWVIGEAVYNQGYSMLEDLVGEASFFQVLLLNGVGRLVERRLADWFEALFICLSWPDARIWCNQVGSLAGTLQTSPVAAVCAGDMASDSELYGPGTLMKSADFIRAARRKYEQGVSIEEIVREQQRNPRAKPIIVGYARPVAKGDERVFAMHQVAGKLGFVVGEHLELAMEIEKFISAHFAETINLAGYLTAFLCDQKFTPEEIYRACAIMVSSGIHACYAEAADQPPESFFPLHCQDIDYQGKGPRPVPESKSSGR